MKFNKIIWKTMENYSMKKADTNKFVSALFIKLIFSGKIEKTLKLFRFLRHTACMPHSGPLPYPEARGRLRRSPRKP